MTSILEDICYAFNSSNSFDELCIKLDLLNISIDQAEKIWSKNNTEILKFIGKNNRHIDGIIDFKKFIKCQNAVLPNKISISSSSYAARTITMTAISSNRRKIDITANYDLIEDMLAMHDIDKCDIMGTMLYELGEKNAREKIH